MKKAIQVQNYLDVEELNKLFADGYEVESVDDNGIYILTKENNIKKSDIKTEMTANITLDTTKFIEGVKDIKRSLRPYSVEGLVAGVSKLGEKVVVKQPHVRIEFDDIRDVPKVWVDGERDYDYNNKHTIIILRKY